MSRKQNRLQATRHTPWQLRPAVELLTLSEMPSLWSLLETPSLWSSLSSSLWACSAADQQALDVSVKTLRSASSHIIYS